MPSSSASCGTHFSNVSPSSIHHRKPRRRVHEKTTNFMDNRNANEKIDRFYKDKKLINGLVPLMQSNLACNKVKLWPFHEKRGKYNTLYAGLAYHCRLSFPYLLLYSPLFL